MKQITKEDKMMLSYKTITFHYPLSNIEIDFNGKNVFKVFTIDNNEDVLLARSILEK